MFNIKFNKEKIEEIIKLYLLGKNTVEIAKIYNTYNTSIRRVLIRNNISLRTCSMVRSYIDNTRFVNSELTRKESYFLGLLVTDGCISNNRITLSLKEEDVYMLKSFASFFGKKVKVNKYFHTAHNKFQYEVKLRSNELSNNLQKLANFINKSLELEMKIPLNFDILRGIIDGDGHVRINTVSIFSNSVKFLNQIKDFLNKYNIVSYIHTDKRGLSSISIHKQQSLLFLYNKMYYSTDLFLKRKKNKFGPLLKKFES